ncbi:MAG: hypothetical protein KAJ12_05020 [Bacteroidetes bacterium]|nr:hypothetical protein [Bacteroidota bacterium]
MKKGKRAMRRVILSRLYDQLKERYTIDWSRESFVGGHLSLPQIDAFLAFKSDPRLEELRGALARLESGTYGDCCCCKGAIAQRLLDNDPARRFCPICESRFTHRLVTKYESRAPAVS